MRSAQSILMAVVSACAAALLTTWYMAWHRAEEDGVTVTSYEACKQIKHEEQTDCAPSLPADATRKTTRTLPH